MDPPAPDQDEYYDNPSEFGDCADFDMGDEEEEEEEDTAEDATTAEQNTATGKAPTTTGGKKKKKEKTPQQKAAHARYMKFYRNVRSILAAILNWSCS